MSSPGAPFRPLVALAGTSGFIGSALCDTLRADFDLRILTRSRVRQAVNPQDDLRPCDHFSRTELTEALAGVDHAVYLVHNRDPSARLDQAQCRDMDLLVADNFAHAAARNGLSQILCRAPMVTHPERPSSRDAEELLEVLAARGVPLTVLRTGLVVGPGGELTRLLRRMVRHLPVIPLPRLAEHEIHPLRLDALLAAFHHCAGNPATFGRSYDIFGPEPLTLRGLLEETARLLGRPCRIAPWPGMPEGLFAILLRSLQPTLHPDFVAFLLDQLSTERRGQDNPVQRVATHGGPPFRETLEASLRAGAPPARRQGRAADDETLRETGRVRSIQRLRLPPGRNAEWVAERYFPWLGRLLQPFVRTERRADGSWQVRLRGLGLQLLRLAFQPDHSTPDRRMYFITGGRLASPLGRGAARLEFRDLLGGRFTVVAIHDYNPALPWHLYRVTQAAVHGLVMKGFQGYMEQHAEGGPML